MDLQRRLITRKKSNIRYGRDEELLKYIEQEKNNKL